MVRVELLTTKLNTKFTSDLPASALQAKVDVIVTDTEADAQKAADRVKAGEDWATVAKQVSKDSSVATTGGMNDYTPIGAMDPAFDAQASTATIGEVSAPIAAPNGLYYVIRVEDRADRPVTEAQKPRLAQKAFNDWIAKMQGELTVKQDFDAKSQQDAFLSIKGEVEKKLIAQAEQQQQQQQQPQPEVQPTAEAQPTADAQTTPSGDQSPAPDAPTPGGGNGQ
ncbi:MAG: hypothetical protein EPO22_15670 [Dehalococcoidia bacterium]|nr:MAG: hypothetical protein EPO22_15670 [Dehalococcoidia bacterium]